MGRLRGVDRFGGCVASYNGSQPPLQGTTLGQKLIDLQKARDAGAISEEEYAKQKTRMLGAETGVTDSAVDDG